jgi:hypothetical protein
MNSLAFTVRDGICCLLTANGVDGLAAEEDDIVHLEA